MFRGQFKKFKRFVRSTVVLFTAFTILLASASSYAQSVDVGSLIQQLTSSTGTSSTGAGTTSQPSTPTTPSTGGRSPITTGLNNVSAGSLQNRAPGGMIAQAIAVHSGSQQIAGDADSFIKPSPRKQIMFAWAQAVVQAITSGFTGLLGSLGTSLAGTGTIGPGAITVGGPLDNQTTTDTGTVIPLP